MIGKMFLNFFQLLSDDYTIIARDKVTIQQQPICPLVSGGFERREMSSLTREFMECCYVYAKTSSYIKLTIYLLDQ